MSEENLLEFYQGKLELKQRLIKEYAEEKNSDDSFRSSKRETKYYVYKAEIELLKRIVDDLERLIEK